MYLDISTPVMRVASQWTGTVSGPPFRQCCTLEYLFFGFSGYSNLRLNACARTNDGLEAEDLFECACVAVGVNDDVAAVADGEVVFVHDEPPFSGFKRSFTCHS